MSFKLDEQAILNIVSEELSNSSMSNTSKDLQESLAAYLGQSNGKEMEGRSSVVSTDIADAVEWIMPEIIKAFTQNNQIVTFDACSLADEGQAELESQFVYDNLMKTNDGFIIIHQFIKDALMQKNGYIKCFYEERDLVTKESYTGLTDVEFDMLLRDESIELIEHTEETITDGDMEYNEHDVRVSITKPDNICAVVSVPPEEFRFNSDHNSVSLKDARFTAHVTVKTAGSLVAQGYDKAFIDDLPTASLDSDKSYRFYMQGEDVQLGESLDPSLRPIDIAECYMMMDIDDDGIAELCKVEVAGGDDPTEILSIEEIEENPFISATCILMSHKLQGLSIYDRLKQLQEQKTTLIRNILDNMYLQNNQRTVAIEGQVNLDDLMVSRPGGIIRAKRLDAVAPYVTPALSSDAYKLVDYLDKTIAGRTGASPDGPVSENMIGDRVGSEGIANLVSKKEELVGLMVRVFAETGIKPLCYLQRSIMIRHQDVATDYKFKGDWITVNPADWRSRKQTTVRVGTGSGDRQKQSATISNIMIMQEKMLASGSTLVSDKEIYKSADDFAKASGLPGIEGYMVNPESKEGQQSKQAADKKKQEEQKMMIQKEIELLEVQKKMAQAAVDQVEVERQNAMLKAQLESQKNETSTMEKQFNAQLASTKQELEEAKANVSGVQKDRELDIKEWDAGEKHKIARKQIAATTKMASDNNNNNGDSDD